ncbi:nuclear pore complex protein Nup58 [Calliphora vicina]|uniref:nuclear pore complex protein Nup58 n=1 Tax=Calliphora vicina TaxID=7373 RepID=UPI00325A8DCA
MSGFSFGAAATSTPAQPQGATSGFSFGAPKPAGAAQTTGFGASTTGFGATTQATGFGATAAAPAFGAPQQAAAPAFGATATSAAPAFGGSSFSFGTPTSAAPATAGTSFGFGAQQAAASSAAAPSLNFAAPVATSAANTGALPSLGLGGGLGGGNFSFMKPAATTSASISFGTTTTTTLGGQPAAGGLFGKPLTTTTAAPAPAPFVGLGGLDVSSSKPKPGDSKQDIKVKETQVPEEIAKTVDSLKTHIKTQKTLSSDIGRTSTSKLTNVSGEIFNLQWALQEISNSVEANYNHIKLLRKETSKTIQSVEMAQRTQDTPVGLQFENNAPFQFFQYLVAKYEQDLINFRQQIALTERHMHSLTNPQNVAPEDLKRGFLQINESFISLAGRLHEIHQKVEAQKDQYLNLRKYRLRDSTNVFAQLDNPEAKVDTTRITAGPTPFSNITAVSNFGKSFSNSSASKGQTTQTGK